LRLFLLEHHRLWQAFNAFLAFEVINFFGRSLSQCNPVDAKPLNVLYAVEQSVHDKRNLVPEKFKAHEAYPLVFVK